MINWIARDWAIWSSIKFFAISREFRQKVPPCSCYLLVDLWLMWTHRSSTALWVGWKGWDEIITACNPIRSFEIHQLSLITVDMIALIMQCWIVPDHCKWLCRLPGLAVSEPFIKITLICNVNVTNFFNIPSL